MMKLHLLQGSPNCRKTMATAYFLSSEVEMKFMELSSGETKSPAFLAINPNGLTPTLEHGDFKLWESDAVMQYLADCGEENNLYPKNAQVRADINRWQFWGSAHYGRAVGNVLWEKFARKMFLGEETDPVALEDALVRFHQYAPVLEKHLSERNFLVGNSVTLADFSLACHAAYVHIAELPLENYPSISSWYKRLDDIPAWLESAPKMPPA